MLLLRLRKPVKFEEADEELVNKAMSGLFPVSLFEGRTKRINWGHLYRALVRLEKSGHVVFFTLRKNGDLKVKWFQPKTRTKFKQINNTYIEYLHPSCIPSMSLEEKRMDGDTILLRKNRESKPLYFPDIVPPRVEVEAKLKRDHFSLFEEEAIQKRRREFGAETSACDMWSVKYKLHPQYFSDVVEMDPRPVEEKWASLCMERGFSVWPSPFCR